MVIQQTIMSRGRAASVSNRRAVSAASWLVSVLMFVPAARGAEPSGHAASRVPQAPSARVSAAQLAATANDVAKTDREAALLLAVEALRQAGSAHERAPRTAADVLARTISPLGTLTWGSEPAPGLLALTRHGDRAVVTADDGGVRLGEPGHGEIAMGRVEGTVTALGVNDDGLLLTGSADGEALLWDLSRPTDGFRVIGSHTSAISVAQVSPDGRWAVVGTRSGQLWLSDLGNAADQAGSRLPDSHAHSVGVAAFTPDARWLLTGDDAGGLRLWALDSDGVKAPVELHGPESGVAAIAASPDSNWILAGYQDGSVVVWDLLAGSDQPLASARLHSSAVTALAVSPDSRWAVSGGLDGTARVFGFDSATLRGVRMAHDDAVTSLVISADGSWLASGSADGSVRVWDVSHMGEPALLIPAHTGGVQSLAASTDNRWLTTLGQDGVRVWPVRHEDLVRLACRTAGRNLTAAEWQRWLPGETYRRSCDEAPAE